MKTCCVVSNIIKINSLLLLSTRNHNVFIQFTIQSFLGFIDSRVLLFLLAMCHISSHSKRQHEYESLRITFKQWKIHSRYVRRRWQWTVVDRRWWSVVSRQPSTWQAASAWWRGDGNHVGRCQTTAHRPSASDSCSDRRAYSGDICRVILHQITTPQWGCRYRNSNNNNLHTVLCSRLVRFCPVAEIA